MEYKPLPLCPILLIGFAPPKDGQRDLRRCTKECAWYDANNDCCSVQTIVELLASVSSQTASIETAMFDGFYNDEEYENFEYNATEQKV